MTDKEAYNAMMVEFSSQSMSDSDKALRHIRTKNARAKLWTEFATPIVRANGNYVLESRPISIGVAADELLKEFEKRFPFEGT